MPVPHVSHSVNIPIEYFVIHTSLETMRWPSAASGSRQQPQWNLFSEIARLRALVSRSFRLAAEAEHKQRESACRMQNHRDFLTSP
jgi:hypothetical protein